MAELTKEQIEAAEHAGWHANGHTQKEYFRAVAPFLQLPWDPLTMEEFHTIVYSGGDLLDDLNGFIAARNAALLPKPSEPRVTPKQKILDVLQYWFGGSVEVKTTAADAILNALDTK